MLQKIIDSVKKMFGKGNTSPVDRKDMESKGASMQNIDKNATPQASRDEAAEINSAARMQSPVDKGGQG